MVTIDYQLWLHMYYVLLQSQYVATRSKSSFLYLANIFPRLFTYFCRIFTRHSVSIHWIIPRARDVSRESKGASYIFANISVVCSLSVSDWVDYWNISKFNKSMTNLNIFGKGNAHWVLQRQKNAKWKINLYTFWAILLHCVKAKINSFLKKKLLHWPL